MFIFNLPYNILLINLNNLIIMFLMIFLLKFIIMELIIFLINIFLMYKYLNFYILILIKNLDFMLINTRLFLHNKFVIVYK